MRALSHVSIGSAAFALLACGATVLVALFLPGGHPPLSFYVGAITVPLVWLLALVGLASAIASRRSVPRSHYVLVLAGNLVAIAGGIGIWVLWPLIAAAD
jgi:hypothetical protein